MKKKFLLRFADNGRQADLELCCFCKNLKDLNFAGDCEHFDDDYVDNTCSGFIMVDDVAKRLNDVLDCRCGIR